MNELDALWALLVAGAAALVLTPLAARFAARVGAVATPRDRDLHDSPTPRMGGLAILAGVLLAGALFLPGGQRRAASSSAPRVAALFGAADDKFDLPPAVKLGGQFLAALDPRDLRRLRAERDAARSSSRSTWATSGRRSRCSGSSR